MVIRIVSPGGCGRGRLLIHLSWASSYSPISEKNILNRINNMLKNTIWNSEFK